MPWKNPLEERYELAVAMAARRESVSNIARRFGVSRPTAYKFWRRLKEGEEGMLDQRRGPRGKVSQRAEAWRKWVLAERGRHPSWGARKLWQRLRSHCPRAHLPSVRTLERWLQAAGLVQRRRRRLKVMPVALGGVRIARCSNDQWTMDWKGWWRTADGGKVEPLTIRDAASRMVLWSQPLATRSDQAVRKVCRLLFRRHGKPKSIRTDQGGPFCGTGLHGLTSLSLWWFNLGIAVEFVDRKARIDNNAHEQMHQVMQAETSQPPASTAQIQRQRLRHWQRTFNYLRPHDALNGRTPAQCYRPRPAPIPRLLQPVYPPHWPVRRVAAAGTIRFLGQLHYVGRPFAGLRVGCQPDGLSHHLHYHTLRLHTLNPLSSQAKRGRG